MSEKSYDKLIRDRIPEIIENAGKKGIFYEADSKEYHIRLTDKLIEEIDEYKEKQSAEELADILEVVEALIDLHQVGKKEFYDIKNKKRNKNGGFEKRLILKKVIDKE